MVGVPGRSKACHTCRRRRKGCDSQKPSCGQCQQAGRKCEGYARERIFLNSTGGRSSPETAPRLESAKYPVVQSSARAPPQILLHDSLWRSASQLKIIDTFLATYLPNSEPFSTEATKYSIGSWVNVVLKLYKQSDLVRLALIANGLGIVGKQNRQPSMNLQGLSVYGQALNKLGLYLKSPQFTVDENLMVVPMLLCLFEILLGVDKNESIQFQRWSSHMAGVTSILTLQHPEYYASGMAHELFVDLRVYQMVGDFVHRKRSVLSFPEWKTLPWSKIPKTPKDALLDILVEFPGLIGDCDLMQSCNDTDEKSRLCCQINSQCWQYDTQLQAWSNTMGASTLAFAELQLTQDRTLNEGFGGEGYAMVYLASLYWSSCALLYGTLRRTAIDSTAIPARMSPHFYIRKVAQSLSYFQMSNLGDFWCTALSMPVGVCLLEMNYTDSNDQLSLERQVFMQHLSEFRGFDISHFLATALQQGRGIAVFDPPSAKS